MIVRLVKMVIVTPQINQFVDIFKNAETKIAKMQGCISVHLHQDIHQPQIFFTISKWDNESSLEDYRKSELFIDTWKRVKPLFEIKAEAWSLHQ